jgi:hypothetical protein
MITRKSIEEFTEKRMETRLTIEQVMEEMLKRTDLTAMLRKPGAIKKWVMKAGMTVYARMAPDAYKLGADYAKRNA